MVDRSGAEEAIGAAEAAPRSPRARSGPADVFISYASPDGGVADAVCGALERDGLICWVAPRDVCLVSSMPTRSFAQSTPRK
jgi:hypothetical protein